MTGPHGRWGRRAAVVVATAAGIGVVAATPALAHAVFVSATPPPGAMLRQPPNVLRMVFSEPLNAGLSGVALYDSSGRAVRGAHGAVLAGDPRAYRLALPRLRPDRYTVVWHTVSLVDGHTRRGSYVFTVLEPDGRPPPVGAGAAPIGAAPPQVPTAVQGLARWAGLAGLFLLAGAVLLGLIWPGPDRAPPDGSREALRALAAAGGILLVAGGAGELACDWIAAGASRQALGAILGAPAGRWVGVRALAAAGTVLAHRRGARPGGGPALAVAGAGVALAAATFAATGHGAASADPAFGLGLDLVHVLGASVWVGGAAALAVVLARARSGGAAASVLPLVRRFSIVAGATVPAVLATGLGNALIELGALRDLVSSAYGWSLLVKLSLAGLLLAAAAASALWLRPAAAAGRPLGRRLAGAVALEAALGLAVLAPTAAMAVSAPSRPLDQARLAASGIAADADPSHAFTAQVALRAGQAEMTFTPGAVGTNVVRVEVPGIVRAGALAVSLRGPGGAAAGGTLRRTGTDHDPATHTIYQGPVGVTGRPGTWRATLAGPAGVGVSAPAVLELSAPVPGFGPPAASGPPTAWLLAVALLGAAGMLAGSARALGPGARRAALAAVGGVGVAAGVGWMGVLAFAAPGPAPPPVGPAWGRTVASAPTSLGGATLWRMPTPSAGLMMPAVAPDGSVWVGEMDANALARLLPGRGLVQEFRFPGGYKETMGIAVDGQGRVWLAQEHAQAIGLFDPGTGHYREFRIGGPPAAPVGIAVDGRGRVWFTEMASDRIGRLDPSTGRIRQFRIPTPRGLPYWLAVGPDGRVWFAEMGAGRLGELDPGTGRVREYPLPGRESPPGVAVARTGTVWATTIQGDLVRLDPRSGAIRRFRLPDGAGAYGIATAPDGTVWVGEVGGRSVYAFDPRTLRFRTYALPPGSGPWWPAVDGAGRVWVALGSDRGNGLARIDPPRP